jgi:hypothetical protein
MLQISNVCDEPPSTQYIFVAAFVIKNAKLKISKLNQPEN